MSDTKTNTNPHRPGSKEAYAQAAADGRHVRFSMKMNFNHVPEELRDRVGFGTLETRYATLTVEDAVAILDLLFKRDPVPFFKERPPVSPPATVGGSHG